MGTITCQANDDLKQIENNHEIKEDLVIKEIKSTSPRYNKIRTGFHSNKNILKKSNTKINKSNKNANKRATTTEKNKIKFNKDIKNIVSQVKKRNTVTHENKIKLNILKNAPKFKKKTFNKVSNKKIVIKNLNINYNNISKDLNKEEFKIDNKNNNKVLNNNLKILDSKNKELKEGIIKTKEKIINIKKELNKKPKNNNGKNIIKKKKININIEKIRVNNSDNIINDTSSKDKIDNLKNNISNIDSDLDKTKQDDIFINTFNPNDNNNKEKNNNKNNTEINTDFNTNKNSQKEKDNNGKNNDNTQPKFNKAKNNKNEKLIKKINEINKKIINRFTPQKRKTYSAYENKFSNTKKNETMDNKQIKNNIPTYRRRRSKSNICYISTVNSCVLDKKRISQAKKMKSLICINNSFNKSLCSSNFKSKNTKKNNIYSFRKRANSKNNKSTKDTLNKNSIQQSYLNISSIINISSNDINSKSKKNKNVRLLNIINKNIIDNNKNINKPNNEDNDDNLEEILFLNFRDAIEIDLSLININESLIDKEFLKYYNNNKIIINYNKIDNFKTSQILYDGIIYKIIESKNKGFKIVERYFQLKKNCFRYYNNIETAKIDTDKPLVQFDIRHIKDLNIVNSDIFKEYKINDEEIKFTFCVFLNQNDDFFVYVFNDEKFGNSIFSYLNLLKNYYEDKK